MTGLNRQVLRGGRDGCVATVNAAGGAGIEDEAMVFSNPVREKVAVA